MKKSNTLTTIEQQVQCTLKALDTTLGDAQEHNSKLPGTKNRLILARLKELNNGIEQAQRAIYGLQTLGNEW